LREHDIITACNALYEQAAWIGRVAPSTIPVLIHGETGTGKELFARLVHRLGPRRNHPFLTINCGALPAEILESELFGHKRGSFTGAVGDKIGLFRAAHGGTLFLDEIGEMSLVAQTKLLRVLESGEVRRVGDTQIEYVDVRLVAATNVDLEKAVAENRFRRDLYYRLKGLEINLPPLRDRLEDVPLLADHFARSASEDLGKHVELTFEATQWLLEQSWPGNVRELRLTVERAIALAPEMGQILPYHFMAGRDAQTKLPLLSELEEIERARVQNALEASSWNKTKAAKLLGMSRTTLSGRVKRLGVTPRRRRD
jgi:transcriptional regulator with PAS, ATPase and Fis domain